MTTNLPFDPESVSIPDLAGRLREDDVDEEAVHALQRADTRKGAAAVYERRVDELTEPTDSEASGDEGQPEESEEEVEAVEEAVDDEDRERGYRITSWAGHPNYECLCGKFSSLDEDKVIRHRAANHR